MGKTILITGGTDGIGKEIAKNLAAEGHFIIIHGRNLEKCLRTKSEILELIPNATLETIRADFSSLSDVKDMAEKIIQKYERLDVLINNAGVYNMTKLISHDGYELNLAVNYLAVVVLTSNLLGLLINSKPSRIINVSSIAHKRGRLDLRSYGDLPDQDSDNYKLYADSKLMLLYYTYYLADELIDSGVTVNALHPGVITTKMLRDGFNMTGDDVSVGAETPVFLALSPNVEGVTGKYFDKNTEVPSSRLSYDRSIREELMQWTLNLLKKGGWLIKST